jgi:two-component sensor histidine kinase
MDTNTLVREIHHRLKNNLQTIVSLINLHLPHVKDDKAIEILKDVQGSITALSFVYEQMHHFEQGLKIDVDTHVDRLISYLRKLYRGQISNINIKTNIEKSVSLDIDTAIPCTLLINELISNSIKHAFPDSRQGIIHINLQKKNDDYFLSVQDDGVGIPQNWTQQKGFGMLLMNALADNLGGELMMNSNQGTQFSINFSEIRRSPINAKNSNS